MVLTQLSIFSASEYVLIVSIPLWFSRNDEGNKNFPPPGAPFPYHYGSHATPLSNTGRGYF